MRRSLARCTSSRRSPLPAKITLWSPTASPPRSAAKPIVPARRAPVRPSRPRTAASARATPRPRAAASPSASAVPEGASTLCRWWISTISISKASGPSARATCSVRPSRRLTPRLMLGAQTIGARAAAWASCAACSVERPVVPITCAVPLAALMPACRTETSGVENSIATSAAAITCSSSPAAMPIGSAPASRPRSWPRAGWPLLSRPPHKVRPSAASTSAITARPIRPAHPRTAIRTPCLPSAGPEKGPSLVAQLVPELLDAGEEPVGFGMGRAVAGLLELAQQLLLALGQIDRSLDHDLGEHVAAGVAVQLGHALAAQTEAVAGLGAGGDLDARAPALDGRHLDLAAERRRGERDRDAAVDVGAVAVEQAVWRYANEDVEVA